MPWGDGRGPEGLGPMTGRVNGFCSDGRYYQTFRGLNYPAYRRITPHRNRYYSRRSFRGFY